MDTVNPDPGSSISSESGSVSNLDPGFWWPKIEEKTTEEILFIFFWVKNCNLLIPGPPLRTSKLLEKPSALNREHSALQKTKFINFLYFFGHFCPLGSGFGLWIRIWIRGSYWIRIRIRIRIHNTVLFNFCRYSTTALTGQVWSWNDAPATARGEGRREKGRERVPPIRRSWGAAFSQS